MKCPFKKITRVTTQRFPTHEESFADCDEEDCMAYNVGACSLCFNGRKSEDMILR
jgi:hypothetical protein